MKYVSIGAETTGLDHKKDQLLQLSLVIDDTSDPKPLDELPRFNCLVVHDRYEGSPEAIAMNSWIFDIISEKCPVPDGMVVTNLTQLSSGVYRDEDGNIAHTNNPVLHFLLTHFPDYKYKFTAAGKNISGFEMRFIPDPIASLFDHRTVDVRSMYLTEGDETVPSIQECKNRAEITGTAENALDDALDVIRLIRFSLGVEV